MTANEWLEVMKQASDFPKGMEKLIVKYGEMLIEEHDSKVKKLNEPDVSVVHEPVASGAVCPHFNACQNGGKNEYCDLQTFNEIDCFVWQTER